eukprot:TRINITY_DN2239_c1_g1_i2.p1 TRINITY_DN2239_c1_g1~~TRINITY_DN2239_c1_g1_i2.p1  ORF type:complete len:344 (-),score=63.12 TRINITY_DN2239_c1_g1_i2:138-1169(-)
MIRAFLLVCLLGLMAALANAQSPCLNATSCSSCSDSECVWCGASEECLPGHVFAATEGECADGLNDMYYLQCALTSTILIVIAAGLIAIIAIVLIVIIYCCVCRGDGEDPIPVFESRPFIYDARLDEEGAEYDGNSEDEDSYDEEAERMGVTRDEAIEKMAEDTELGEYGDNGSKHFTAHAISLIHNKRLHESEVALEKALKVNPHDYQARALLLYVLSQSDADDDKQYIDQLGKDGVKLIGQKMDAGRVAFLTNYAIWEEHTGRLESAEKRWTSLLGNSSMGILNPKVWALTYANAALFHMNALQSYDTALRYFDEALERDSGNVEFEAAKDACQRHKWKLG